MLEIEEISAKELKNYIFYSSDIDLLKSHYCAKGSMFLLRKNHLGKEFGVNMGNDVLIVNPEDFENCEMIKD